jgi:hypothetical protein
MGVRNVISAPARMKKKMMQVIARMGATGGEPERKSGNAMEING